MVATKKWILFKKGDNRGALKWREGVPGMVALAPSTECNDTVHDDPYNLPLTLNVCHISYLMYTNYYCTMQDIKLLINPVSVE